MTVRGETTEGAAGAGAGGGAGADAFATKVTQAGLNARETMRANRANTRNALLGGALERGEKPKPAPRVEPKPEPKVDTQQRETEEPTDDDTSTETVGSEAARADDATDDKASGAKPDGEPKPDPKPDPEQEKRVAAIQKQEQRHREQVKKDRAELEAERKRIETEWAPRIQEAKEFAAVKAQVKRGGAAGVLAGLRALGYTEAEFNSVAQIAYAHSPEGAKDTSSPSRKAAAERAMAERGRDDELAELRRKHDDLEARLAKQDQERAFADSREKYLDLTVKEVGDATPLAKRLLAKSPSKLRAGLWTAIEQLTEENGEVPDDLADVVARFEQNHRAELEELGIDPKTFAALATATQSTSTTDPKKNNQPADKKQPAKTLGNDLSTTRVPRERTGERDQRARTRALVASGQIG